MKKRNFQKASVAFLFCFVIAAMGCGPIDGCEPKAKYERTVNLSAPLSAGSLFEAQTHNGYVDITGTDVTKCNLTATIIAKANTEEKAQKLAEEVKVELVPSGDKLTAKIEKPILAPKECISVNLDVTVPDQTSTDLTTHNGALKIKNLTGQITGTTHNGRVAAEKISGTAELKTHNGEVACKEASGDIKLRTHNGNAKAFYSDIAPPACNISIVTHNGSVNLTAPRNLSARVEASTHNGSIDTDFPITVTGKIGQKKLTGTIGAGEGQLYLETHNGSISINEQ
jgi:DUF4097 and DUF4098 domain-containing protein YvlB